MIVAKSYFNFAIHISFIFFFTLYIILKKIYLGYLLSFVGDTLRVCVWENEFLQKKNKSFKFEDNLAIHANIKERQTYTETYTNAEAR